VAEGVKEEKKRTKVRFLASWLAEKKKDICEIVLTAEVGTAMTQTSW
jgi:hypothetical protein